MKGQQSQVCSTFYRKLKWVRFVKNIGKYRILSELKLKSKNPLFTYKNSV